MTFVNKPDDIKTLAKDAKDGKITLFIGSGVSRPTFVSWTGFVEEAKSLARDNAVDVDNLSSQWKEVDIISHCRKKLQDEAKWLSLYDKCFSKSVNPNELSAVYRYIGRISSLRHIITTNYDSIPAHLWPHYDIYGNTKDEIITLARRLRLDRNYCYILKIHGCHTKPSTMVVTKEDYSKIIHDNTVLKDFVSAVLKNDTVLFVGFGFNDDNIERILENLHNLYSGRIFGGYAILPSIDDAEYSRLKDNYDIRALTYQPKGDVHDSMIDILEKIFPTESMPDADQPRESGKDRATGTFHGDKMDVSELLQFNRAFLLGEETKIIYTCRSFFNIPPFKCPSEDEDSNLKKSRTIRLHIPVDEVETYGLCFSWYGIEILGNKEDSAENATICSKISSEKLLPIINWPPKEDHEIDKDLTRNLLIIGENHFSNNVFPLISHLIPWRHIVTKSIRATGVLTAKYSVRPSFVDIYGHEIDRPVMDQISSGHHCWGIITLVPNPFAPEKWMLFFIGCSRPGQYLLLSWLRNISSTKVLSSIIKHVKSNDHNLKYIQVVVRGDRINKGSRGQIDREWRDLAVIDDISGEKKAPFFIASKPYASTTNLTKEGDEITDFSLLAKVENDQIRSVTESLPKSLEHLLNEESTNSNIGFHVTLYEFLHKKGWDELGFVESLLQDRSPFLAYLKYRFQQLPPINITMRQARITPTSLQVLVDIHIDMKSGSSLWQGSITDELNAMDFIVKYCHEAREKLPNGKKDRLNINDSPFPLHLTLLRFNKATGPEMLKDANKWVQENQLKIWGKAENLSLILVRAKRFPFQDVALVTIDDDRKKI